MQRARLSRDNDTQQYPIWQPATAAHDAFANAIAHSPRLAQQRTLGPLAAASPRQVAQRQLATDLFGAAAIGPANRTGLPDPLKQGIEALSGVALDSVRVHYNSTSPAQLGAHAYAQGQDIHLAPGQERHLPHEAWHIVQQAQGRVAPTLRMANGAPLNDDARLEHEADTMGARALQGMADPAAPEKLSNHTAAAAGPVQRVGEDWIGPIAETLGIAAAAATQFVSYLLRTYPIPAIVLMLGGAGLAAAYARYRRKDEDESGRGPGGGSESESESESESGSESESKSESESESKKSESESESETASEDAENTDDFRWVGKKAVRARGKLSPYRKAAWDEFVRLGPPVNPKKKSSKPKKKKNWNEEIVKSKRKAQADSVALVPKSAPYKPYKAIPITGSTPFFVNIEKRAEGTKSSSLSGKSGTKPLAVVYGHHGAASYNASALAEVHVHFNDDDPVDSHTGAHVKVGTAYPHSWGSGNASGQADLAGILDEGFHGDAWTRLQTYR
ncbi:eCIS core domain-containing protein [Pseudoduganella chitinolytica]|uniref:DUF4157 domain-containing protein n=1 Tax=Pseudoduganella chitinolytica TaxID=34070 RepID=A0ABY8BAK8_9BURK|nr:DUF4157 domain-containing protein [Pseudoduganella chitinolytica]WEF32942.1 DUF4157 domain-containing protein [Pseudoduganella chitinolytica]